MAVSIKKVTLWRTDVENKPGALCRVLSPLAEVGADLQVVMGYHYSGNERKAAIEVCPISGKKLPTANYGWTLVLSKSGYPAVTRTGSLLISKVYFLITGTGSGKAKRYSRVMLATNAKCSISAPRLAATVTGPRRYAETISRFAGLGRLVPA